MQELMQKRKEQLAQATITQLRRRGFEAEWFDTAAQAREAALQLLPEGCTVAWGGSATIREMGLTQAVHAGNWTAIDRDLARTPEERADLHRQGLLSDWYLMSANAISAEGVLVNIDGTGNRLAALCYGPRQILVLCSADKIRPPPRPPLDEPGTPLHRPMPCGLAERPPAPPMGSATTA